jgi:hypothetical protein
MILRSFLFGALMYLSWFLFFVAGILFSNIFSAFLDLGITVQFARIMSDRILIPLIMIAQELEYLRELKIEVLKQKGLDEKDIQFQLSLFDKWFTNWKESIIVSFISTAPESIKKEFPFNDWASATKYVEKLIKEKRI